jgi:hypothetical protein
VFLVVVFQPFPCVAAVITDIHSSLNRLTVDDSIDPFDILASNPGWNQFFVVSGTHKTKVFIAFPLQDHYFILVDRHIFFFF